MFTKSTHVGPVWATKTTFLRLTVPVAHMTHPPKPLKLLNNCNEMVSEPVLNN